MEERVDFNTEVDRVIQKKKCGFYTFYVTTEEGLEQLKSFQVYPDDVWVVSFPKSGTTWTKQIVKLIRSNGVQDDKLIHRSIPYLEGANWYTDFNITELPQPRAFYSHFPYDIFPTGLPCTTPCKYIYVARNLKDVAVSYFFFLCLFFKNMQWDTFWPKFISWELGFGNYFDHVLSWWEHRNDDNVLFIKYEDMKKDLPLHVSKIASHIGVDLSDDVIAKIVDLTTFDKMRNNPTTNYEWRSTELKFMRKGIVGDWKNFLSEEQSSQVDALCAERLAGTGLKFDFE